MKVKPEVIYEIKRSKGKINPTVRGYYISFRVKVESEGGSWKIRPFPK